MPLIAQPIPPFALTLLSQMYASKATRRKGIISVPSNSRAYARWRRPKSARCPSFSGGSMQQSVW